MIIGIQVGSRRESEGGNGRTFAHTGDDGASELSSMFDRKARAWRLDMTYSGVRDGKARSDTFLLM